MPSTPQNLRVFLVDDIDIIRDSLVVALAEVSNAKVVATAKDEAESVAWLRANPEAWDVAAVDLFLKTGSGLGVLKACRDRKRAQRVAVLTNYATPAIRDRCLASGANAVFDKSTELEEFLRFCTAQGHVSW